MFIQQHPPEASCGPRKTEEVYGMQMPEDLRKILMSPRRARPGNRRTSYRMSMGMLRIPSREPLVGAGVDAEVRVHIDGHRRRRLRLESKAWATVLCRLDSSGESERPGCPVRVRSVHLDSRCRSSTSAIASRLVS